eukprot:TRINITY_DN4973_c0_g1_i3.p1 TRINITY_DN4973_c0_g1~~TRINITY_DN4973_c0_g1_i3.p1  ORF type:complete len:310 (-),score=65.12 TRINITY_DN4973_c0_g1_i3:41-970(-)
MVLRFSYQCYEQDVPRALQKIVFGTDEYPFLSLLPLGGHIMRFLYRRDHAIVRQVLSHSFNSALSDPLPADAAPRDLLDVMMSTYNGQPSGLSKQEILDELFILFLAGHETSSLTLSFCLYELALNQDIQQRVYDEVQSVLGTDVPTREDNASEDADEVSADQVHRLVYMQMVLKETLRMYPPTVALPRTLAEDTKLYGHMVAKGTSVSVLIDAVHHDPEYWPEPDRFDPERFTDELCASRHPLSYIPFTNGPRICIGQHFFWLESRTLLAQLVRRFVFKPAPGYVASVTSKSGSTRFARPLELVVERR